MLSISHTLTGALIASKVGNPILYVPLVLASHYLEDWIPHWDVGTGLSNGTRKKSTAIKMEFIELGISAVLLFLFWQMGNSQIMYHVWFGAFVGLIPDFMEAPKNFLNMDPWIFRLPNKFHHHFHGSIPSIPWGLTPQIILWVVIWFLR